MDLFGKARSDRKFLAQVKEWTIDLIDAGPEDSVVANEIRCDDPDCPPHETVLLIALAGEPTRQVKVPKPAAEVLLSDLQTALQTNAPPWEGS